MRTDTLTRAALATVASAVALVPLAGCSDLGGGPSPSESVPATESTRPPESSTGSATGYEDGTYNAIGVYGGGPPYLDVTATISDKVIADITVALPKNQLHSRWEVARQGQMKTSRHPFPAVGNGAHL